MEVEVTLSGESLTDHNNHQLDLEEINKDTSLSESPSTAVPAVSDDELPSFLIPSMLAYLRGVFASLLWQSLVREYLDFEKDGPQTGVSPFSSRVLFF